jgi:hypothetical protein
VVVCDFDVMGILALPPEADPVLIVDSDALFACAVAAQSFQAISRRNSELRELTHPIDLVQLAASCRPQGLRADAARRGRIQTVEDIFGGPIPKRSYHG